MFSVSIIIPTYNEAKNLPLLTEEIFASLNKSKIDAELIVVDDNSPDGTGQVAEELAKKYPIKTIHRAGKMGLGSAVRAGFTASTRSYLGVMDADLSHDPSILNDLICSLEENDLSLGSRFLPGSFVENWSPERRLLSRIGVFFARCLTRVTDPLSGYFFFRRSAVEGIDLTTTGYKILLEIVVKGKINKIKEFSFRFRMRQFSASKLNFHEHWLFLNQLLQYSWYKLKKIYYKY